MYKNCIVCGGELKNDNCVDQKFDTKKCSDRYHNVKRHNPDWNQQQIIEYLTQKRYCLYCEKDLSDRAKDILFCDQNCRRTYRRHNNTKKKDRILPKRSKKRSA